jgi:hypothetical protein
MILWLALWARTTNGNRGGQFFSPMIYPYWLLAGNGVSPPFVDLLDISIKNSYPAKGSGGVAEAIGKFQDDIKGMSKQCNISTPFVFSDQKIDPSEVNKSRKYIYDFVSNLWEQISPIDRKYTSYGTWALVGTGLEIEILELI